MKSLFKNVNTFGLMGVLLAGGLLLTQSAFKPVVNDSKRTVIYGYDPDNLLQHWAPENAEDYFCQPAETICKYSFSTPPTNSTPPSAGTPLPAYGQGVFRP